MAHKSVPTNGKGRRPIIGYNNEKFRANYDSIFKKKATRMKALDQLTQISEDIGLYPKPKSK